MHRKSVHFLFLFLSIFESICPYNFIGDFSHRFWSISEKKCTLFFVHFLFFFRPIFQSICTYIFIGTFSTPFWPIFAKKCTLFYKCPKTRHPHFSNQGANFFDFLKMFFFTFFQRKKRYWFCSENIL